MSNEIRVKIEQTSFDRTTTIKSYNSLVGKPKINGVELIDDKSLEELGIEIPEMVNADWNATSGAAQILNKPDIPVVPEQVSAFENDSNYQTAGDIETAIQSHNSSELAHDDIRKVANEANTIARGKATSLVFDTFADMEEWLKNAENKGKLKIGDNLYIVDTGITDRWVSAVLDEADAETGYYYEIGVLEGERPDLSNMMTTDTAQTVTAAKNFTGGLKSGGNDVITTADIATTSKLGIVSVKTPYGIGINSDGNLYISPADNDQILEETRANKPLVCSNYRFSTENVMAKTSETALTIADSAITLTANIPEYTLTAGENFTINVPTVVANRAFHFCIHANITTDIVITFPTGSKAYNGVPPYFTAGDWDIIIDYENGVWKYGAIKAE